jgi:hypothetical protein
MATACWAFIVAKSTLPEAAPLLDFPSLQRANMEIHQQLIHKALWIRWGQFLGPPGRPGMALKRPQEARIVAATDINRFGASEVNGHLHSAKSTFLPPSGKTLYGPV